MFERYRCCLWFNDFSNKFWNRSNSVVFWFLIFIYFAILFSYLLIISVDVCWPIWSWKNWREITEDWNGACFIFTDFGGRLENLIVISVLQNIDGGKFPLPTFMKKKLKQWWSTIQTILTKRTTTYRLNTLPEEKKVKKKKKQTKKQRKTDHGKCCWKSRSWLECFNCYNTCHQMCCYQTCIDGITFEYLNGVDIALQYYMCISDLYLRYKHWISDLFWPY